jgi:hypothetical protein
MDRAIIIGVPLGMDYKIDSRVKETVDFWDNNFKNTEVYHPISSSPEAGRDMIVQYAKYRRPKPAHIMFLDADVLPRKTTLQKLLKMDKDIVTGVYPINQGNELRWSVSRVEPWDAVKLEELPRNPFKVMSAGFGVTLIKYEVFEKLEWPYWKNVYRPGAVEISEDIYFFNKARKAGYDVWCDPLIKCDHPKIISLLGIVNKIALLRKEIKQ